MPQPTPAAVFQFFTGGGHNLMPVELHKLHAKLVGQVTDYLTNGPLFVWSGKDYPCIASGERYFSELEMGGFNTGLGRTVTCVSSLFDASGLPQLGNECSVKENPQDTAPRLYRIHNVDHQPGEYVMRFTLICPMKAG